MHLHQDPILAMEEEYEEINPSRAGERKERDALMVRMSLREEESFILVDFHGHGRPWEQGAAAARGREEEESVWEWRVRKMSQRGGGVAGQVP